VRGNLPWPLTTPSPLLGRICVGKAMNFDA
jgi:hypothetical protein